MRTIFLFLTLFSTSILVAQHPHSDVAIQMKNKGLEDLTAYKMLKDLTTNVGHRLSGSIGYEKAVAWGK